MDITIISDKFQVKSAIMIFDIKDLIEPTVIGFYKRCEVIQISYYEGQHENESNIFTLLIFDELEYDGKHEQYLTNNKNKINKKFKLSIKKFYLKIEEAISLYTKLKEPPVNDKILDKYYLNNKNLKLLPFQFISSNEDIRINNVLKNNFGSGSYIFEFFDENKKFNFAFEGNDTKIFNKISEMVREVIPIDLSTCSDCLGNYIFQLPVNLLNVHTNKNNNSIKIDFFWNSKLENNPNCLINISSKHDGNYLFNILEKYNNQSTQEIEVLSTGTEYTIKIWNSDLNLLLYEYTGGFIEQFRIITQTNPCNRMFLNDGEKITVPIKSKSKLSEDKNYLYYKDNAVYEKNLKNLEKELKFKRYWKDDNALKDIIKLINEYGENGVCILDPYLESKDILNTLMHLKFYNAKIRAITSLNNSECDNKKSSKKDKIEEYKKLLDDSIINSCGLNLEFRAQYDNIGKPFHDRFLIFPGDLANFKKPVVFSLGTSLNSYGKNLHILQEVSHPQYIVDEFEQLWDELKNHDRCLIWSYPE